MSQSWESWKGIDEESPDDQPLREATTPGGHRYVVRGNGGPDDWVRMLEIDEISRRTDRVQTGVGRITVISETDI